MSKDFTKTKEDNCPVKGFNAADYRDYGHGTVGKLREAWGPTKEIANERLQEKRDEEE